MAFYNAYESESVSCVLGDTLRPGGFQITDRAVEFCKFSKDNNILDIGCGKGATVQYLEKKFLLNSYGIDPSNVLLKQGKNKNSSLKILKGTGENIPFENESMDGVFAECTLSLMNDLPKVIEEAYRVVKKNGWLIVSDVYAKNPEYVNLLQQFSFNSCMRGLHSLENLKIMLASCGFEIMLIEDYSDLLKQLMVKIVFSYGSMSMFWSKATSCSINSLDFQQVLSKCKVGYFLIIAKKED